MQSPDFNTKYAESITDPDIKSKVAGVSNDKAALVKLLNTKDDVSFGSGAWFLTTQCPKDVRAALAKGDEAGWKKYITDKGCVGTTVTDERKYYWGNATLALGK